MKIFSPYWWFNRDRKPDKIFQFSEYVIKCESLRNASFNRTDNELLAKFPTNTFNGNLALESIYKTLNILDTKSSALMRLNGVMLAAATLLLNPNYGHDKLIKNLVALSGVGSTVSISFCLLVVSVDWAFLSLVKPANDNLQLDFTEEFYHLQKVVGFRSFFYRSAWTISFFSTLLFLIAVFQFFRSI